jgi:hypothetical protein
VVHASVEDVQQLECITRSCQFTLQTSIKTPSPFAITHRKPLLSVDLLLFPVNLLRFPVNLLLFPVNVGLGKVNNR